MFGKCPRNLTNLYENCQNCVKWLAFLIYFCKGCSQTYISTHAQHRERNIFASPGVHHRGEMPWSQSGHDYFEAKSGYGRWSKQLKNPVFRRFCLRGVSTPGVLGGCPPLLPVAICCMLLQVSEIRQQFCWIRGGPCRATYPRPVVLHLWNFSNFREICQNSLHVLRLCSVLVEGG